MSLKPQTFPELNAIDKPVQITNDAGRPVGTYNPPPELYELFKKLIGQITDLTNAANLLTGNPLLQEAKGDVDGTNKIFVFKNTPLAVFVNGLLSRPTDYDILKTRVTFKVAPDKDSNVFAIVSPS